MLFYFFILIYTMKFKKKINIKKTNDNQRKSKAKKDVRKKKTEKKIL